MSPLKLDENIEIMYNNIIGSPVHTPDINAQNTYISKALPIPNAEKPVLTMPDHLVEHIDNKDEQNSLTLE